MKDRLLKFQPFLHLHYCYRTVDSPHCFDVMHYVEHDHSSQRESDEQPRRDNVAYPAEIVAVSHIQAGHDPGELDQQREADDDEGRAEREGAVAGEVGARADAGEEGALAERQEDVPRHHLRE